MYLNSELDITPSDLKLISTITSLSEIATTTPSITCLDSTTGRVSEYVFIKDILTIKDNGNCKVEGHRTNIPHINANAFNGVDDDLDGLIVNIPSKQC